MLVNDLLLMYTNVKKKQFNDSEIIGVRSGSP